MKKLVLNIVRNSVFLSFLLFMFPPDLNAQEFDLSTRPAKTDNAKEIYEHQSLPVFDQSVQVIQQEVLKDAPASGPVPQNMMIPGDRKISGVTRVVGVKMTFPDDIEPSILEDGTPVPEKITGIDTRYNNTARPIATSTYESYSFYTPGGFPDGAVVTDLRYSIRIDDNGDEGDFYPYDYEIYITNQNHGWYYDLVWDNVGSASTHTDGGYDDDAEDDTDIYLLNRSTSTFNGEAVDLNYFVRIVDNFGASTGNGIISWVYLYIHWEAPDPNLDATWTPGGWDDPIVISEVGGNHYNADGYYINQTYYIDLAIVNRDQDINESFTNELWVDGVYQNSWTPSGLLADYYYQYLDQTKVFTTAGTHTVCSWADSYDVIDESDETDNIFCRSIQVYGVPAAPTLESPENFANCQSVTVGFDWNDPAGAVSYRLVVDDDPSWGSRELDLSGIAHSNYTLSGLSPNTTYYWCVTATNPAGTSSWSSVYRFTTSPTAPSTPGLSSPSHEATCIPVDHTLYWNSSSGSSSYALQVDNNSDFSSPVVNLTGLPTSYDVVGLDEGETYYWRVAGLNSCGVPSSWSSVRSYTTVWHADPPTLTGPADDATCQGTTLDLTWSAASGATSYHIWVDNNNDFSSPEIDVSEVSGTSYEVTGLSNGTTYHWAMASYNACDVTGDWAAIRQFTTSMPSPGNVSLNTPADGATCEPVSINLSWNSATNAHRYILQVDDDDSFGSPIYDEDDLSSTSQTVSGLANGETYFWRVKARNGCGAESSWSSVYDFSTIINSVATPALNTPADAADCQPTTLTLSWNSVAEAEDYELQVDNNSDFSSPEINETVAGTSFNCSGLSESSEYFWRVKAVGTCSVESGWSASRRFETGSNGLDVPLLSNPADLSSDLALTVNLSWTAVADATSYQVQLDDNFDFSSPLLDESQTETSIEAADLDEGTTYYWHVMASAECASSDWSDTWEFETESEEVAVEMKEGLNYSLKQNVPNPFTEFSLIEFSIPVDGDVTFELINVQGKLIKSTTQFYKAGEHTFAIEADDLQQTGVFIYRMKTNGYTNTGICIVQ